MSCQKIQEIRTIKIGVVKLSSTDNVVNFAVIPEPPISTPNCPRLYGIFPDEVKCDTFWNCWNGEASRYQCSPGLAYDRESRVCMWADQVPECKLEGGSTFIVNLEERNNFVLEQIKD